MLRRGRGLSALPLAAWLISAWGVLSFGGGVYPWAYWPLLVAAAGVGIVGTAGGAPRADLRPLQIAYGCVILAVALQLLPLPRAFLMRAFAATHDLLLETDFAYSAGVTAYHSLSIDARLTVTGLAFIAALGVYAHGLSSALSKVRIRPLIRGLTLLGLVVATAGVIQKALGTDLIYGVWRGRYTGDPFGPFINRNHFGGWILMMLPVSLAYAWGLAARHAGRWHQASWRNRLLWLGSQDASEVILALFACGVMMFALGMSLSRSGIACGIAAITFLAIGLTRRRSLAARTLLVATVVALVAIGVVMGAPSDGLARRIDELAVNPLAGRAGAWADALRVTAVFPLTGTGVNTYGTAMVIYQRYDLAQHYAQAHNDYLQLLAEGGLLVGMPLIVTAVAFCVVVRRRFVNAPDDPFERAIRFGALAGVLGIGLQEVADFSLQMPGNAVLCCVLLAILMRDPISSSALASRAADSTLPTAAAPQRSRGFAS
jgi:O-antigen ligase